MNIKSTWNKLSNLGIDATLDSVEILKIRLLNQILWFSLFICIVFSILFVVLDFTGAVVSATYLLNFCYALGLYLISKKYHLLARHLAAFMLLSIIIYNVLITDNYSGVMYLLFPLSAAVYFLIKRPFILYYNISYFIIIGIYWVRFNILYDGEYEEAFYIHNLRLFSFVFTLFALIAILDFFEKILQHYIKDNIEKRRFLEDAQSVSEFGSWSYRPDLEAFTPSEELKAMFGLSKNLNFPKETLLQTVSDVHQPIVQSLINLENKDILDFEYSISNENTIKYYRFRSEYKEYGNEKPQIIGTIQNITQSTIQKLENERLLDDLKRSNHELEQFAYIASHDLQEPLRMVGNFVELLEEEYGEEVGDEGKLYIEYAVNGVRRMSRQIDELLQYSRVGRKEKAFKNVRVRQLLENKITDMLGYIKEHNANVRLGNVSINICCIPNQIELIFQNLIHNGIKFSTNDQPLIIINSVENDKEVIFSVKDNGIGIAPKNQDKIFEIFKRLHRKEVYAGTGIGLALVKRIVLRHGGNIWIESELGKGTTFFFTIPKTTVTN